MTGDRTRLTWTLPVALLAVALGYRLAACVTLPVVLDEIYIVAYGLERAFTGDGGALWFETPVTTSNGMTPLWFWLQAVTTSVFGVTAKLGLRLIPIGLGLLGTWLAFRAGTRHYGARAGLVAGLAYAVTGLLLYTNVRGEFTESLVAPLLLLLVLDLDPGDGTRPIPLRAALWPGIALFTYLGKGLIVLAVFVVVLGTIYLLRRLGRASDGRLGPARAVGLVLLPLLPSLAFLAAAQAVVFRPGRIVFDDYGVMTSVWSNVAKWTFGYGTELTDYEAGLGEVIYPYTDFTAWPVLAVLAVAVVGAFAVLGVDAGRAWRERDHARLQRAAVQLGLTLPVLVLLLAKVTMGGRFHLLYLAPLLPALGSAVSRWIRALEEGRLLVWFGWGTAAAAWIAWAATWVERGAREPSKHIPFRDDVMSGTHDWALAAILAGAGVAVLAILAGARAAPALRARVGGAAVVVVSLALLVPGWFSGVLDWGTRLAWEPGPQNNEIQSGLELFPHPDEQLADHLVNRGWVEGQPRWFIINLGPWLVQRGLLAPDASPAEADAAIRFLLTGKPALAGEIEGNAALQAALRRPGAAARIRQELRPMLPPSQHMRVEVDREVVRRHAAFLRAAIGRHPDDADLLGRIGARLISFVPETREEVLTAWRDHLRRHPESSRLRDVLQRAERMPPRPPTGR